MQRPKQRVLIQRVALGEPVIVGKAKFQAPPSLGPRKEKAVADPIRVPKDSSLTDAIALKVKMLIIGSDGKKPEIAELAAKVAEDARQPNGFNARVAIWITEVTSVEREVLDPLFGPAPYPDVAVLKRDNSLGDKAKNNGDLTAMELDLMFRHAGA
jgi:hypothetical protein